MDFPTFLQRHGRSQTTIDTYCGHIGRFYAWCEETFGEKPSELYRSNVLEFQSHLLQNRKLNPATVNVYMSALAQYNAYGIETGQQTEQAVQKQDYIKIQSPYVNPWDGEEREIDRLRQAILAQKKKHSKRDYALITVMAYGGLRVSEAVGLQLDDVFLGTHEMLVRNGKGEKARTITMNDKIVQAIRAYLVVRPNTHPTPYLFVSQKGERLRRGRVNQICRDYSTTVHPHMLRHFFCTKSQSVGYDLYETAQQAGHKDPRTTMRYAHPSKKAMLEKANRM